MPVHPAVMCFITNSSAYVRPCKGISKPYYLDPIANISSMTDIQSCVYDQTHVVQMGTGALPIYIRPWLIELNLKVPCV